MDKEYNECRIAQKAILTDFISSLSRALEEHMPTNDVAYEKLGSGMHGDNLVLGKQ